MSTPDLTPEERARVAAFGLDRPELGLDAIEARTEAVDGMTVACREGQHHACVGDPWRVTVEDPIGCSCQHHQTSNDVHSEEER